MSKYQGTKTEKNLQAAFAGESQARNKYTYFASVAKKEGYEQIAELFLKTADNEKEHAKLWFKELGELGDTAKNLFGGIVIFLDKPFVVGDWIQMDIYEGTVEDITFRSTRVRTFENSLVNIPNSIISNASIINWSKMEKRRYRTNLCLAKDTPLEKLERFKTRVEDMLQSREAIFDDSIIVKFDTIANNGLNVLICSYTDSVDYTSYLSEREDINCKIMKILKEENIELAYDTKTVYVKN